MQASGVGRVLAPLVFLAVAVAAISLIAVSGALPQGEGTARDMLTTTTAVTIEVRVGEPASAGLTYRVRQGDTWGSISDRVGMPVERLKAYNGIQGDGATIGLRPGLVLKVPAQ